MLMKRQPSKRRKNRRAKQPCRSELSKEERKREEGRKGESRAELPVRAKEAAGPSHDDIHLMAQPQHTPQQQGAARTRYRVCEF